MAPPPPSGTRPANWDGGIVPNKGVNNTHAVINTASPNIATITVGIIAPVDIIIGTGSGSDGRLDHRSGEASTGSGNWMFVGTNGGAGTYNLANTSEAGGGLTGFATGTGSMNTNGGRLYVGGFTSSGSNGIANINTTGKLTVGSELNISADGGTGVMNLENGEVITNNWTRIGGGAGSNGTLNMTGGLITKQGAEHFVVGGSGSTGVAHVSGGSITVNNQFWIGNGGGSTGTLNFSNGSITNNSWVAIGRDGATKGTLNFTGGSWNKTGDGNFIVGDNSPGEMNMSGEGASLNVTGEFWVGQAGGGNGTMTFSSGSITNSSWVAIGRQGGLGVLDMTGGTWTKNGTGSNFIVGSSGAQSGTMNMSGGSVTVQPSNDANRGITWVGELNGVTGNLNLSGTAEFTTARVTMGEAAGATGNLNLNGGTLNVGRITGGAGTANVTFNGTQINASAASAAFIENLDSATIGAGGFKINTNFHNLASNQLLGGTGGIEKTGFGTLTLTGANTYAGANDVIEGKLVLSTATVGTGAITVGDYCGLGVIQSALDDSFTTTALTLGTGGDITLDFDLGNFADNSANAPLIVSGAGAFEVNGFTSVNITDAMPVVGTIPLISYNGGMTGGGWFSLDTLPDGVIATIEDSGSLVYLDVTRANDPYWTGAATSEWNTADINWQNQYGDGDTTYADPDPAMFDDRVGAGPTTVTLDMTVAPGGSGVTFANSEVDYTLSGSGKITGSTGLLKTGTGTATVSLANDFTGETRITGGTLSVPSLADGGVASPIGASDNSEFNLVLAGGTLQYTGASTSIDRGFTVSAPGSGIRTNSDLTFTGPAYATGAGNLNKSGTGNLTLAFDGFNSLGGVGPAGVTVDNGTLTLDGTGISQFNSVSGDIWLGTTTATPAHLVIKDTTVTNSGNFIAIARGNGTTGLTSTCTITNSTVIYGNLSLGYANNLAGYLATSILTMNDSSLTMTGVNHLGESGGATGILHMNGNSSVTSGATNVARHGGSNGTLNVRDTSLYTSNGRLHVGSETGSVGNVLIEDSGSMVVNTFVSIGFNGTGGMTVRDDGSFATTDDFSINESGDAPADVYLQDNGSISAGGVVFVGRNTGRVGTMTQTGGTFTGTGNEFQIGKFGQGVWLQSGGVTNAGGWVSIGRETGGTGTLSVSGTGTFNQTGTDRSLVVGENGTGTLNIEGSATVSSVGSFGLIISNLASGVGTVNLDGGTLSALRLSDGGGSSTFNFNGGTLVAGSGADSAFMGGLDNAVVKSGGANIDSNGQNIAINQVLLDGTGGGGLTKTGAGVLLLNAANTYTGTTTVSDGVLGGNGSVAGPLSVSASATIAPGASVGTFAAGTTTLAGTYACEIDGATADVLTVNGDLDITGAVLTVSAASPHGSPWIIATYTGSLAGTFASVTEGYTVDYDTPGEIRLVQAGTPYGLWAAANITAIDAGADATPGGDPDGDGVKNIAEFALDGDPLSGADTGKMVGKVASVGGDPTLVLTLPVRTGATFSGATEQVSDLIDGVIYTIQGGDDLVSWNHTVSEVLGGDKTTIETGLPALNTGWEYRTFQTPGPVSGDPRDFLRAVFTTP